MTLAARAEEFLHAARTRRSALLAAGSAAAGGLVVARVALDALDAVALAAGRSAGVEDAYRHGRAVLLLLAGCCGLALLFVAAVVVVALGRRARDAAAATLAAVRDAVDDVLGGTRRTDPEPAAAPAPDLTSALERLLDERDELAARIRHLERLQRHVPRPRVHDTEDLSWWTHPREASAG